MNIFILSDDPNISAQMNCDTHVIKICTEATQILSTASYLLTGQGPYKPTHPGHPWVQWALKSKINSLTVKTYGLALCKEYEYRFARKHACENVLKNIHISGHKAEYILGDTMPQCVDDDCRNESDIISAYRKYYIVHKSHLLRYTKRNVPDWVPNELAKYFPLSKREIKLNKSKIKLKEV